MTAKISQIDALSFDDVLIKPLRSSVFSRKEINTESHLVRNLVFNTPIISANMDTVTGPEMLQAMFDLGGIGALHRFMPFEEQLELVSKSPGLAAIITVGVAENTFSQLVNAFKGKFRNLNEFRYPVILIDVAHGHSERVFDLIKTIRTSNTLKTITIIAGNVATYQAAFELALAGVDSIKVGVGPGAVCSTRVVTGCGVPQLTAIMEVTRALDDFEALYKHRPTLIADGGIKTSGDIVKALVAGANFVMLGSLLAGTQESPGEIITVGDKQFKKYRGMASRAAQQTIGVDRAPEGVEAIVPFKGSVHDVVKTLMEGVRSGMSYLNAHTIADFHNNDIEFIRMSQASRQESHPHIQDIAISVQH
jgi:IMP dehydrogenase